MSQYVLTLLEYARSKRELKQNDLKSRYNAEAQRLLNIIQAKQWREEALDKCIIKIYELKKMIKFTQHLLKCRRCQIEAALSVERYRGKALWFTDLDAEEFFESYQDCPKVTDYRIGCYGNDLADGTIQFIRDRARWALKKLAEEIRTKRRFFRALVNWDCLSPLPPYTSDEYLFPS